MHNTKAQSFYVGPAFTARPVPPHTGESARYEIVHGGEVRGTVFVSSATKNIVAIGAGVHSSLRQAGIAVLRAAGVKSDLEVTANG